MFAISALSALRIPVLCSAFLVMWLCPQNGSNGSPEDKDWARVLIAEDPLSAKSAITLEDLEQGIANETSRKWVIPRHFPRAELTTEQQRQFLTKAFQHSDPTVRQQAALELARRDELRDEVRSLLDEWIVSGDQSLADAAIIGIQYLNIPVSELDPATIDALIDALGSESNLVATAAARKLQQLGPAVVPALLEAMQDEEKPQRKAADVLSRIVGDLTPQDLATVPPADAIAGAPRDLPATVSKAAPARDDSGWLVRKVDAKKAEVVRVYYGTNRKISDHPLSPTRTIIIWASVCILAMLLIWYVLIRLPELPQSRPKHRFLKSVVVVLLIAAITYGGGRINTAIQAMKTQRQGAQFGRHRASDTDLYYGYCDVSIPPTHDVGKVERPTIGPEDETRHVVLKQVELLDQGDFYAAVNEALTERGDTSRDCLLYIHGYNVTFDEAAMRTAQIHFDLKFHGTTMFFSWPSRASVRHYFSDRAEIQFSHLVLKDFLAGILDNAEVDRFHVIAHSMGADALCQAILELDPQQKIFDQIILAAPDIDTAIFQKQILPRLGDYGNRTTLYCSKNDWALHASRHFNDSPRAGDSSNGPFVAAGIDTIDASEMDTELLGHSYYGNCLPLLNDLRLLIEQDWPPDRRQLEPLFDIRELPYWVFIE